MRTRTQLLLSLAASVVVVGAVALTLGAMSDEPAPRPVEQGESLLVRDDSHVLGEEGDSGVTFVEFLDFECEGCRAAYPAVEQLREDYRGRVTFVARYFPMPGHANGEPAARAVQAAAQQGRFEEMYHRMYETQEVWGEQQAPMHDLFATFADDLGLDMERFTADYEDPATAARVAKDVADGIALGVSGTPTFFVDGEPLQPESYADLTGALDAAIDAAAG